MSSSLKLYFLCTKYRKRKSYYTLSKKLFLSKKYKFEKGKVYFLANTVQQKIKKSIKTETEPIKKREKQLKITPLDCTDST